MGNIVEKYVLVPFLETILLFYDIIPFSNYFQYRNILTGLIKLVVHRAVLNRRNLYKAPPIPIPDGYKVPTEPLLGRTDDGFGTDYKNPTAAMTGATIGRNMPELPKHLRDPHGKPDVQMVAQRLLAREDFKPAGDQLNIIAASWIQAMVHDWIGHFDGDKVETLDKGAEHGCPFASFRFKNTKPKKDGSFDSERSQWWDASFVYGQDEKMLNKARAFKEGKMKTNATGTPHLLPENEDGTYIPGDNKNSWVGIALLQELFLKEHNFIADKMGKAYPDMTDQQLFDASRMVISALVAKIHTIDWTVELLKTRLLEVGMKTNWYGLPKAWISLYFKSALEWVPTTLMAKVGNKASDNKGTPYCLTEEFAAVYRLHSLSPPGLIVGKDKNEFITLLDCFGDKGREAFRKSPERPTELMKSCLSYPCGGLLSSNYPVAYRNMAPTTDGGADLPKKDHIDLAALDLYRDRERGIRKFNDFRRSLNLKPYRSWIELTGDEKDARKLELIYGPGQAGIERLDLLVGDMYEKKPQGAFALSETSFIIFLVMASRRLEADPYLNENYTEKFYTEIGLKHVEDTMGLFDLLERHYPDLAKDFTDKNGKQKQSAFKPTLGPEDWSKAIDDGVVPKSLTKVWEETKAANEKFFDEVEEESENYYKNLKSHGSPPMTAQNIYILVAVLLIAIPYFLCQVYSDYEPLRKIGIRKLWVDTLWPAGVDVGRELAYSNVRHNNTINRLWHLPTNPLIYVSQTYLMDKTFTLGNILGLKLNCGGMYFVFLVAHALSSDLFTGVAVTLWLVLFYALATNGSYDNWLTRLVGDENKLRTAFFMYLFCQYSQINFHNTFEQYYDWNLYHLFVIQQQITVYNLVNMFGIYPEFSQNVTNWEPAFGACLKGDNHPIDCW